MALSRLKLAIFASQQNKANGNITNEAMNLAPTDSKSVASAFFDAIPAGNTITVTIPGGLPITFVVDDGLVGNLPTAQTITIGTQTPIGLGGHRLGYTGNLYLGIVTEKNAANANSTHFMIDSRNEIVARNGATTTFGASPPTFSSQYTVTVAEYSDAGKTVPTGRQSVVTINPVVGEYTVTAINSGLNADNSTTNQLKTAMNAANPGTIIRLRDGMLYNPLWEDWRVRRPVNSAVAAAMTGNIATLSATDSVSSAIADNLWIQIKPETKYGANITRLQLEGNNQKLQGFWFNEVSFDQLEDGVKTHTSILKIGTGSSIGEASYVRISGCRFRSNLDTSVALSGTKIATAIDSGAGTREIYIHDNLFDGVYDGVSIVGMQGVVGSNTIPTNAWVVGNTFTNVWNDCRKLVCAAPTYSLWNFDYNKRYGTGGLHGDFEQRLNTGIIAGTYEFGVHVGNISVRGNGTLPYVDGQGLFQTCPVATAVTFTGARVQGYLYVGTMGRGITLDKCVDPIVENNTLVRDTTSGVTTPSASSSAAIYIGSSTGGTVRYNVTSASPAVTFETGHTGGTSTYNIGGIDTAQTAAAYAAPAFGSNADTLAKNIAAWAFKLGGTLDSATTGYPRHVGAVGVGIFDYINRIAIQSPVVATAPVVSGTSTQGSTLTAVTGSYTGGTSSLTVTGQWKRNGVDVVGMTGLTYTLFSADVGANITYVETAADENGGVAISTSNTIGPVAALTTSITYPFDGANNVAISTLGWERMSGTEALFVDGAGNLKKSTTTDSSTIYLGAGSGAKTQKLVIADMAASTLFWTGVMCKIVSGGLDGYILRKSSTTNLRLHRFTAGVAANITLSIDITAYSTLALEAIAGESSTVLNVYGDSNPTPIYTYTDTDTARKTSGRAGIQTTATGVQATLASSMIFTASNYVGGSGVFNSVAVPFGRATPANMGSMQAQKSSLGVLASGEVGDWEFVKTFGNSKWPDSVASGSTPAPSTSLDDTDASTIAVYSIRADGSDTGKTFTINVQSISGEPAITVASPANITTLKASHASLGGKVVEFLEGCSDNFGDYSTTPATFNGWKNHSGVITIRSAPTGTKAITSLYLTDCARINVIGARISNYLPVWPNLAANEYHATLNPGGSFKRSDAQNRPLLTISLSTDINVQKCTIGAPVSMQGSPERWYTGVSVSGSGVTLANKSTNIVIGASPTDPSVWTPNYTNLMNDIPPLSNGNLIRRVKDGYVGANLQYVTFRGNIVRDFCSNASFFGGLEISDFNMWDFWHVDGWLNPSDVGDHPDTLQFGSSGVAHDYERIRVRRGIIQIINADKHSQGPFFNDIAFSGDSGNAGPALPGGGKLTGFKTVDCEISNVAHNMGTTPAFLTDVGTGWTVHNCTMVRGQGANIQSKYVDPQFLGANVVDVNGDWHKSEGVASHLAGHSYSDLAVGMTVTNSISYNAVKGAGTGLTGPPVLNEAVRGDYYDEFFADPLHVNEIERFRPKTDGALKNADGSYAGCFYPDMSWAAPNPQIFTPVLNNITLNYGDRTTPGDSSTVLLKNIPGLVAAGSPEVVSWRTSNVVAIGGGNASNIGGLLSTNTATATARTPNPTLGNISNLATVTLPATSYTMTVTAVGVDNTEATCTMTWNIVPNAFNIGDANDGDIISSRLATDTGGYTWLISTGYARTTVYSWENMNPTGRTTIRYADPTKPSKFRGIRFNNSKRLDLTGLRVGGPSSHRFHIDGMSDDCTIRNCSTMDASYADINVDAANNHSAFYLTGVRNLVIEDNVMEYVGRPIQVGGIDVGGLVNAQNVIIRNNKFRKFYADAVSIGKSENVSILNNVFVAWMRNRYSNGQGNSDHIDGIQFSGDPVNPVIEGNVWIQAEGNTGSISMINSATSVTGMRFRRNLFLARASSSLQTSNTHADAVIEDVTLFLTASGKIAQYWRSDDLQNDNIYNGVQNFNILAATSPSIINRVFASGNMGNTGTNWTKTNNKAMDFAYGGIVQYTNVEGQGDYEPTFNSSLGAITQNFSTVLNYTNAFERTNNYHPSNNPFGLNYEAMTIDEIVSSVLTIMAPKVGGELDLGSGVSIGAVNFDGTLKTDGVSGGALDFSSANNSGLATTIFPF